MPLYVFKCSKCDHEFEKLQSFSAEAPACPKCGVEKTEKQITAHAAATFNGVGVYMPYVRH
jgi:putative FmdB family regulatory protein